MKEATPTAQAMIILKLRNHIPLGAPARREPADGTESPLRVSLGFEPAWFTERCGTDFSEAWHRDPVYRNRSLCRMREEVISRFPSVTYWRSGGGEPGTLSGCYGAYVIPYVFGMSLRYGRDRWPVPAPERLPVEEIEKLDVEKILGGAGAEDLRRQMDIIEREFGAIHGYLNWQGILNNAFHIRGAEIFTDILDKPEFVRHFFSLLFEVMTGLALEVQARQRKSGFYINQLSLSNCVMNMISPETYRDFVFPFDSAFPARFERFGLHTCNWIIDPYIEILSGLPGLGYIDMGFASDLKRAKAAFPQARRAVMYSPVTFLEKSPDALEQDVGRIARELAPCDIVLGDLQSSVQDERIRNFLYSCRKLENEYYEKEPFT
ncbi:MAG: hypothetical protein E4H36_03900 [Spirochaetales bacterium]|nr:MAG: hypothetical protein E4H36_03900 [Spirochaetales bacterium]